MSSISSISGSFTGAIAKSDKGSSSETSKSTLLGKEVSTSFDSLSFNPSFFKQAFTDSFIRINTSLGAVRKTDEVLTELVDITDSLLKIAHRAAQRGVTNSERATMETRFQKLISQFKQTVDKADASGIDFLDKDELQKVLKNAGIDLAATTTLSDMFEKIGGSNQKIGRRTIVREDEYVDDGTATSSTSITIYVPEILPGTSGGGGVIPIGTGAPTPGQSYASDYPTLLGVAGDGTFRGQISTSAAGTPYGLTRGDFNADGIDDLASVAYSEDKIFVMIGNGDGTFAAGTSYASGSSPVQIRSSDVNGDSVDDLIAVNASTISVYIANGDGSFAAQLNFAAAGGGARLEDIQVGDLNGDSKLDVITSDIANNQINILLGNGNGTFGARTSLSTTGDAYGTRLVDLNNDGNLDLAYSDRDNDKAVVQLGTGNGNFGSATSFNALGGYEIVAGDFNADGQQDLAVGSSSQNVLSVLLGNGDGSLKGAATYLAHPTPGGLVAVDMNLDGLTDLVSAELGSDYSSVFLANSDGTLKASTGVYVGSGADPFGVVSGDFNQDGVTDLAFADHGNGNLSITLGHPASPSFEATGTFDPVVSSYRPYDTYSVNSVDFNRDGIDDLISTDTTIGSVWIGLGNGDGTFKAVTSYLSFESNLVVNFGDMNNDGYTDILATETGSTDIIALINDRNGGVSSTVFTTGTGFQSPMQLADVNGDGNLDAVGRMSGAGDIGIYLGNGNGTFQAIYSYSDGAAHDELQFADMNNDGKIDIVSTDNPDNQVSIILGNGDGTFQSSKTLSAITPEGAAISDFNGDGHLDIFATQRAADDTGLLFLGNGDGNFKAGVSFAIGLSPDEAYAADFNGDGFQDVIVSHDNNFAAVLYGNGDGTFAAFKTVSTGNIDAGRTSNYAIGDFDDDGVSDIISAGGASGNIYLTHVDSRISQSGTGSFEFLTQMQLSPSAGGEWAQAISTIDLNKDGNLDLVAGDAKDGIVNVMLGNGNGTFNRAVSYEVTASGATAYGNLSLADFNGDGFVDIGVPDTNLDAFSILLANSNGTFKAAVSFGQSANGVGSLVTADFDGDGKADVVTLSNIGSEIWYNSGNGDGSFDVGQTFSLAGGVGAASGGVALDFDDDGKLDLAVNDSGGWVEIFRGNGDGTFHAGTSFTTFSSPIGVSMESADMDGDGESDLVLGIGLSGTVAFMHGNGDGSFSAISTVGDLTSIGELHLADINRDGKKDIVSIDIVTNKIVTLLSNGDGTFKAGTSSFGGLDAANSFALGDFDNDGVKDIAALNYDANEVTILKGESVSSLTGSGEFQSLTNTSTVGGFRNGLINADFNDDGILDFATVESAGWTINVEFGNGDGTFGGLTNISTTNQLLNLLSQDVNGDGYTDIVGYGGGFNVILANGDGTFKSAVGYGGGTTFEAEMRDMNRDGYLDMVMGSQVSGEALISLGTGTGTFGAAAAFTLPGAGNIQGLTVNDFNNDGFFDVVLSEHSASVDTMYMLLGAGDGSLGTPVTFNGQLFQGALESADINNDGFADLVNTNKSNGYVGVMLGNGDGTFKSIATYNAAGGSLYDVKLDDLDGDGLIDATVAGSFGNFVLFGNGDGSFKSSVSYSNTGSFVSVADLNNDGVKDISTLAGSGGVITTRLGIAAESEPRWPLEPEQVNATSFFTDYVASGDINNDGFEDVFWTGSGGGGYKLGNGDGSFKAAVSVNLEEGSVNTRVSLIDMDNDGNLDVVRQAGYDGIAVKLGNGDGTFTADVSHIITQAGTGDSRWTTIGDFNNDYIMDIAAADFTSGKMFVSIGNGDGTFDQAVSYAAPSNQAISVASGDMNSDGELDILMTGDSATEVWFGNGDGTFKLGVSNDITWGRSPLLADLNGDGYLDYAHSSAGDVCVALGNGDGTLKAEAHYVSPGGSSPMDNLRAGDLDGDGRLDLIINNIDSTSINVLMNNGNGTFQAAITFAASGGGDSLTVADFNRDGRSDVVASHYGDWSFGYYQGVLGTEVNYRDFYPGTTKGVGFGRLKDVETADFNEDGNIDILTQGDNASGTFLFLGNGNNTFKAGTDLLLDQGGATAVGDFNGDGHDDILFSGSGNGNIALGNGNGTFKTASAFTSFLPADYNVTDINGDGKDDILTADYTGKLSVYISNGDGTFKGRVSYLAGGNGTSIELADLNGDGKDDVILQDFFTGPYIGLGNGDGTFKALVSYADSSNGIAQSVGDVNGDGKLDLVQTTYAGITLRLGNGDGSIGAQVVLNSTINANDVMLADNNGDGKLDILFADSGPLMELVGNGDGTFKSAVSYAASRGYSDTITKADVDNDGILDAVTTSGVGQVNTFLGAYGSVSGGYQSGVTLANLLGRVEAILSADFNEDGNMDILSQADSSWGGFGGDLNLFFGNGDNTLDGGNILLGGYGGGNVIAAGDLNGDGHVDIAVANSLGDGFTLLGNGDGNFKAEYQFVTGEESSEYSLVDVSGDGKLDLISSDYGGTVSVYIGNGDGTFKAQTSYAAWGRGVGNEIADLNNDGKLDIVHEDYYGLTFIGIGNGDGSFQAFVSFDHQIDTGTAATPMVGDLNGDGKKDVMLVSSSGLAVRLGNGDGTIGGVTLVDSFDYQDAILVDDDGDGKLDILTNTDGNLYRYLGNGDGTFKARTSYIGSSGGSWGLTRTDMNNDGIPDIVTTTGTDGTLVSFLKGGAGTSMLPGNGTFVDEITIATTAAAALPAYITSGDLNNDGKLDLFFADTSGSVGSMLGNGNGTFKAANDISGAYGSSNRGVNLIDFNNDGKLDYLLSGGGRDVITALGNGDGTFKAEASYAILPPGGDPATQLGFGDFNGDTFLDVTLTDTISGAIVVALGNGNGSLKASVSLNSNAFSALVGDINNDGDLDIYEYGNGGINKTWLGNGDGTFAEGSTYWGSANSRSASLRDMNGDGFVDVVGTDSDGVYLELGNGDGTFGASVSYSVGVSAYPLDHMRIGDLNADGDLDIAVVDRADQTLSVLINNGNGTFKARVSYAIADESVSLTIGDFNGDGINDIMRGSYNVKAVGFFAGANSGSFAASSTSTTVSNTDSATGGTFYDPLKGLSVKTRARAVMAEKTLKKVKADLQDDLNYVKGVEQELSQALKFAISGASVAETLGSASSAKALAESIARRAQQEGINGEQQKLDTALVTKLLGD